MSDGGNAAAPQGTVAGAPRRGRTLLIAGIAGLLVLCAIASVVALVLGRGLFDTTRRTVAVAETHYSAAMSAVETASAAIKDAPSDPTQAGSALQTADTSLRTGREQIAAARAAIGTLEDSNGKKQYLASLDAADEAFDALQDMVAYLGDASGMIGKVQDAGRTAGAANEALNAAIAAGNRSAYDVMKQKATLASGYYSRAAALFAEAHKLDPTAGLDKAAAYAVKRKQQADLVGKMADEGKRGDTAAYNKDIASMNALGDQAEKIGDPAIVSDPQWAQKRLASLEQRISDAGAKADQLHRLALQELGMVE